MRTEAAASKTMDPPLGKPVASHLPALAFAMLCAALLIGIFAATPAPAQVVCRGLTGSAIPGSGTCSSPVSGHKSSGPSTGGADSLFLEAQASLVEGMPWAQENGSIDPGSGELIVSQGIYDGGGVCGCSSLTDGYTYRSNLVDPNTSLEYPSQDRPFGEGFLQWIGERLEVPVGEPAFNDVIRYIDSSGVATSFTQPQSYPLPPTAPQGAARAGAGGQDKFNHLYEPCHGWRLFYQYVDDGNGGLEGVWFREFPDRTRVEYRPVQGSSPHACCPAAIHRPTNSWAVRFHYLGDSFRIDFIEDARGYVHRYTWQYFHGFERIAQISLEKSSISNDWSKYNINFDYDESGQLVEIQYPRAPVLYDYNHDGSYDVNESFDLRKTIRFSYMQDGSHRLKRIWLAFESLDDELWLENTYDTAQTWRLASQSTAPNRADARTYTITYPAPGQVRIVDPLGISHEYESTAYGSTPSERTITRYTRRSRGEGVDPRPGSEGRHDTLVWEYSWETCGCGCARPLCARLPSGREISLAYDAQGRGKVTRYTLHSADPGEPDRSWHWSYESWGLPWDSGIEFTRASRLKEYRDEAGQTSTFTFLAGAQSGTWKTVIHLPEGLQAEVIEDGCHRVLSWREPVFSAEIDGGGSGTSRGQVDIEYSNLFDKGSYGLPISVTRYRGLNVTEPVVTRFEYDPLGNLHTSTEPQGKVTTLEYNNLNQVTHVSLSPATTARNGQYPGSVDLDYDLFGGIARVRQSAHDVLGVQYPRSELSRELVRTFFGEPWKSYIECNPMSDSGPSDWLVTTRSYDALGRQVGIDAPGGRRTEFLIDDQGQIYQERSRKSSSEWVVRTFWWTVDGQPWKSIDATGLETVTEYDGFGRPASVERVQAGRKLVVKSYAPNDALYEVESLLSGQTMSRLSWSRDALGRVKVRLLEDVIGASSDRREAWYNGLYLSKVADENGRWLEHHVDPLGRIRRVADSLDSAHQNQMIVQRDAAGQVTEVESLAQSSDAQGGWSEVSWKGVFEYDTWGRMWHVQRYGRSQTLQGERRIGYDSLGRVTWQQDSVGKEKSASFDALARVLSETLFPRPGSGESPVTLNWIWDDEPSGYGDLDPELGAVLTRLDARAIPGQGTGHPTVYLFDKLGRLREKRLPGFSQGAIAFSRRYELDAEGRLVKWRDGNGREVLISRDAQKLPVRRHVDPATFGDLGAPSWMTSYEEFAYDDANRETSARTLDFNWYGADEGLWLVNETTKVDGLGRLVQETFGFGEAGGGSSQATQVLDHGYTFGTSGEDTSFRRSLTLSTNANQWGFEFSPDGAGKLASMTFKAAFETSFSSLATWRYEGARVRGRDTWLAPGAMLLRTSAAVNDLGYLDDLSVTRDPGGNAEQELLHLERGVDAEGNITWERYAKVSGAGDGYLLDGHDRLKEVKLGVQDGGELEGPFAAMSYDRHLSYALDEAQNHTQVSETFWGGGSTSTTYTLDPASNRYTQVGNALLSWDDNGNLISDGHYLFAYDYLDRLCEIYEIYADGEALGSSRLGTTTASGRYTRPGVALTRSEIRTLVETCRANYLRESRRLGRWDLAGRRIASATIRRSSAPSSAAGGESSVELIALYGYDPSNRRVYRTTSDVGASWTAYDGWKALAEWDGSFEEKKVYLEGRGIDEHLGYLRKVGSIWERYTFVQGPMGHVMAVVGESGEVVERYEYDAYGRREIYDPSSGQGRETTVVDNAYGYTGRRHDPEAGLIFLRNRYLNPVIGRFLTMDPVGNYYSGINWGNGYTYVGNSPYSYFDPLGLIERLKDLGITSIEGYDVGDIPADSPSGHVLQRYQHDMGDWDISSRDDLIQRAWSLDDADSTIYKVIYGWNPTHEKYVPPPRPYTPSTCEILMVASGAVVVSAAIPVFSAAFPMVAAVVGEVGAYSLTASAAIDAAEGKYKESAEKLLINAAGYGLARMLSRIPVFGGSRAGTRVARRTCAEVSAAKGGGKAFSKEKQALVDMAKKDKRTGMTSGDMQAYKDLNKGLPDPFPANKVRGPEVHPPRTPNSPPGPGQQPHGHVGPVNYIPINGG